MSDIDIRQPDCSELIHIQQLRHRVLDPARQIEADDRLDPEDFDRSNIHVAAFLGHFVVGTVRLDMIQSKPPVYEVRKMAVDPAIKRCGVGRRVMEAAIEEAKLRGCSHLRLDARESAVPFFERLGFELTGEQVVHADGVPNFVMKRVNSTLD